MTARPGCDRSAGEADPQLGQRADPRVATSVAGGLSAYIRTLNESSRIAEAVRAALAVADEVVVVDSGSTDGTRQIAEAAGARVIAQPWLGNGGQKRAGEDACRHDWLLDLDADEVVSSELAAEIRALFASGPPAGGVYALKLVTVPPYGPVWTRASLSWRNKLYDRRRVRMPDHKAWDQLALSPDMTPTRLRGALWHHSFRNIGHVVDKLNRVSGVRARESRLKSYPAVVLRVIFAMPVYFLRHYLLRGLWRAGLYGFAMAVTAAVGRWLRDVKMLERHYDRRRAGSAPV
jgi:glycosyltransferase involved in cell wall biosynthesis